MLNWALPCLSARNDLLAAAQAAERRDFAEALILVWQADDAVRDFRDALIEAQKATERAKA